MRSDDPIDSAVSNADRVLGFDYDANPGSGLLAGGSLLAIAPAAISHGGGIPKPLSRLEAGAARRRRRRGSSLRRLAREVTNGARRALSAAARPWLSSRNDR
jgi:hypothetical protein